MQSASRSNPLPRSLRGRAREGARLPLLLLLATCFFSSPATHADESFDATVTRIFDGDSFLVRPAAGGREIDVRLADIDAPEKKQIYGDKARAALQKLIANRTVRLVVVDTDQYGRKVVRVYRQPDQLDIAHTLVHDGHVWVWRKYARDKSLFAIEDAAKAAHLGLWALPASDLQPPWQYRYELKNQKVPSPVDSMKR